MAIYTVQDTTMTALGDAVRKQTTKYIGSIEKPTNPDFILTGNTAEFTNGTISGIWETYRIQMDLEELLGDKFPQLTRWYIEYNWESNNGMALPVALRLDWNGLQGGGTDVIYFKGVSSPEVSSTGNVIISFNQSIYPNWGYSLNVERCLGNNDEYINNHFNYEIKFWACNSDNEYLISNTMTPAEMIDIINDWDLSAIDRYKYSIIVPKTSQSKKYTIPSSDLVGLTQIGQNAFAYIETIENVEFPEGLISIGSQAFSNCSGLSNPIVLPSTLSTLGNQAFFSTNIPSVKILNKSEVIDYGNPSSFGAPFASCNSLKSIYVPSNLYYDYQSSRWGQDYSHLLTPYGEWVFDKNLSTYLAYSNEKEYSISLLEFSSTPDFSIILDKNEYAEITDISINDDNTEITFKVKALNSDGVETLTVTIYGEVNTYTLTGTITVVETLPEPTYEVVAIDGASYGFALNDSGYYESQNKGKSATYALCQVNISNMMNSPVYFDCISYAESNYDYGILGAVNQTLSKSTTDDSGVKKNFKGLSSSNIQTVEYTDAIGNCFIQIKYKKDGSGDQNNDSLQFKVRFE